MIQKQFSFISIGISLLIFMAAGGVCIADFQNDNLTQNESSWRFPGEFEQQEAVWIGWISEEYLAGYYTDDVMKKIVAELEPHVRVVICVPNELQKEHVLSILDENNIPSGNISFYFKTFTRPWWRDFGPIFTVNQIGDKRIADFSFNCWGYSTENDIDSRLMETIDRDVAKDLGIESVMTRVISEGGDRECNGKGTLIVTEACEFQRNPNVARELLEEEYKRLLGVTNIIWLKQGLVDDDRSDITTITDPTTNAVVYRSGSANNHIDEYCRFVSPDTILLAEVTEYEARQNPVAQENRRRLEENFRILRNSVDQDGNPFIIKRIPVPDMQLFTVLPTDEIYAFPMLSGKFQDGTAFPVGEAITVVPAMSYCNFLISNGIVIGQKYWEEGAGIPESVRDKDEKAHKILQQVFPDREVVMIHTLPLNFGGGGIHCSTQQEP